MTKDKLKSAEQIMDKLTDEDIYTGKFVVGSGSAGFSSWIDKSSVSYGNFITTVS